MQLLPSILKNCSVVAVYPDLLAASTPDAKFAMKETLSVMLITSITIWLGTNW